MVKPERTIIHDAGEHRQIVDAVLQGDGDRAAEAMRRHIANVGEKLAGLEDAYRRRKGLAARS